MHNSKTHELKKEGSKISVTKENCEEYLNLVA